MPKRKAAFPWRGGKYRLAPSIVKLLPQHKIYVEVFGGAASVLLAKPPSQIEVYNDRDGALVNLFEVLRNHPLLFIERCEFLLYSRELYQRWGSQVKASVHDADIDRVEAAVRTCYSISSGFVGDPSKGWAFDRSGSRGGSGRWTSIWERIAFISQRMRHVNIDCLDFRDCIKNWDTENTLFFLDPPYRDSTKGYYDFTDRDHTELATLLPKVKGKWLMTYADSESSLELYRNFEIRRITSSLASQKVSRGMRRAPLKQLLISNFKLGE